MMISHEEFWGQGYDSPRKGLAASLISEKNKALDHMG
jgi:hypothetical protein